MRTFAIAALLAVPMPLVMTACETETPTTAVVENDYPAVSDGGDPAQELSIYKVWYSTTVFLDPLAPGQESDSQRIVPASDHAYVLLAAGWDPSSTTTPAKLIPIRSTDAFTISRGGSLRIGVSDPAFVGNCGAGKPLSQDDADFITQRIFPGDFAAVEYDAKTCTSIPLPSDGRGDEGGTDAGGDAGLDATADSGG